MNTSRVGRFDRSFMFHMIRDFFLLLIVVAAVEMAIRYALLLVDFRSREPQRVDRAAQQLADDVKAIMLNSGGPTAARTVYPILNRAYDELGLSIAVQPSDVTVESMKLAFKLEPQGLPPRWPAGEHQAASVKLVAEQFCLGCHVKAQVGEVLGTVTVRSYLARKESGWWQEVRVTAAALSLKIVIHTIVLLLLLKVRMEPLLRLRATVAGLAKGVMDLSPRAQVKSEDEFAELALDLNHFLDRITLVVRDLDRILAEVVAVGERLGTLNRHLEQQLDGWRGAAQRHGAQDAQRTLDTQSVAAREAGAFDTLLRVLDEAAAADVPGVAAAAPLRTQLQRLGESFHAVARAVREAAPPAAVAQEQALQYQAFAQSLREMALLEATMQKVAESGQAVLQRLARSRPGEAASAP